MNVPGGADVRYRCVGCACKMKHDEHVRNLTVDKFTLPGSDIEHTMTVILCDTCKPIYDRLVRTKSEGEDALDLIQQLELECVQKGGEHDGATG